MDQDSALLGSSAKEPSPMFSALNRRFHNRAKSVTPKEQTTLDEKHLRTSKSYQRRRTQSLNSLLMQNSKSSDLYHISGNLEDPELEDAYISNQENVERVVRFSDKGRKLRDEICLEPEVQKKTREKKRGILSRMSSEGNLRVPKFLIRRPSEPVIQEPFHESDAEMLHQSPTLSANVKKSYGIVYPQEMTSTFSLTSNEGSEDDSTDRKGYVNLLFQIDDESESLSIVTYEDSFGKKGKSLGEFQDATDIILSPNGKLFVTDMINSRVQLLNRNGRAIMVFHSEEIVEPWGAAMTPSGYLAVTSRRRKCVVVLNRDGEVLGTFGQGFFLCPCGIDVDKSGNFIVTDIVSNKVSVHSPDGNLMKCLGDESIPGQRFAQPRYVTISPRRHIIVSDSGNHCLKLFDEEGNFLRSVGRFGREDGHFKSPHGVCTDSVGDILVADHYNDRISLFSSGGEFVRHLVTSAHGLAHPQGIALSMDSKLFITHGDMKACEVVCYKVHNPTRSTGNDVITVV